MQSIDCRELQKLQIICTNNCSWTYNIYVNAVIVKVLLNLLQLNCILLEHFFIIFFIQLDKGVERRPSVFNQV